MSITSPVLSEIFELNSVFLHENLKINHRRGMSSISLIFPYIDP